MEPIRRFVMYVIPVVMLVTAAFTAGAQTAPPRQFASTREAPPERMIPPPPPEQMAAAQAVSQTFAQVASRVSPSVVRIVTRSRARASDENSPSAGPGENPFEGTPFEHFFDENRRPQQPRQRIGMGSGVVIDARGYILTNNHVVEDADQVRVSFVDGNTVDGRVVGTDPKSDLAVVRVQGVRVQPARFGDSDRMRPGESVIAIGNPFGLDHSVTVGVLSAKNRAGLTSGQYEDFLQTDASINPGNSGGPLVNLDGDVIGINTMIVGLGTGVGFAVASSMARPIAQQLIERGRVVRPYIGIVMQSLTPELRRTLGRKAPERGALIAEVQSGSPAARAGLRPGDVVISVDGKPMEDSHGVQLAVLAKSVGASVALGIWRDGHEQQVTLKTVELPGAGRKARQAPGRAESEPAHPLGLALESLTPELDRRLGLDPSQRGAIVTGVRGASPAAEAGFRPGDIVVDVDRQPVTSAEDAARALSARRPEGHLVRVRRGDGALFLVVPAK